MPQLMPLLWEFSVILCLLLLMLMIYMYNMISIMYNDLHMYKNEYYFLVWEW